MSTEASQKIMDVAPAFSSSRLMDGIINDDAAVKYFLSEKILGGFADSSLKALGEERGEELVAKSLQKAKKLLEEKKSVRIENFESWFKEMTENVTFATGLAENNQPIKTYLRNKSQSQFSNFIKEQSGSDEDRAVLFDLAWEQAAKEIAKNNYEEKGEFKSWFFNIARNQWEKEAERRRRVKYDLTAFSQKGTLVFNGVTNVLDLVMPELIKKAINNLPKENRDLLLKRYHKNISATGIAAEIKSDVAEVGKNIFHSKRKLIMALCGQDEFLKTALGRRLNVPDLLVKLFMDDRFNPSAVSSSNDSNPEWLGFYKDDKFDAALLILDKINAGSPSAESHFFSGLCRIYKKTPQYRSALKEDFAYVISGSSGYKVFAEWYQILAFWKTKKKEAAVKGIKEVMNNETHPKKKEAELLMNVVNFISK